MTPEPDRECLFCAGHDCAFEVTVTGSWAHLSHLLYGGVRYFVHGAVYERGTTHLWLVPEEFAA